MGDCQLSYYLENYLDSVGSLPGELKRNFTLIEELDQRTKETLAEIEVLSRKSTTDPEKRAKIRDKIIQGYNICAEFADEKIGLAAQTYELVDKHIRRLDNDLRKFETELSKNRTQKNHSTDPQAKKGVSESSRAIKKPRKGKGRGRGRSTGPKRKSESKPVDLNSLQVDIDMPVDPNEPTYCFCNRVSFGEMVCCDNSECRVEWFHFECVGLTTIPKGKWLCPECSVLKREPVGDS